MPTYVARVSVAYNAHHGVDDPSELVLIEDGPVTACDFSLSTAARDERGRVIVGAGAANVVQVGKDGIGILYGDEEEAVVMVDAADEDDVIRRAVRTWGDWVDVDDINEAVVAGRQEKVFVATVDTGGISYSGVEYAAMGSSELEARERLAQAYLADTADDWNSVPEEALEHVLADLGYDEGQPHLIEGSSPLAEALNDYYSVTVLAFPSAATALRDGVPLDEVLAKRAK